ncbi:hypothetical protein HF086_003232 [Spodoptera exigua]|uniref:Uncharacterized protein n=1 Tax=Spodoptera exigua TaxID=7107 RepID=A0A922MHT7_SPOEX|nr:hypothetical protein HF086_003232 [Spodoptera exigua]
MEFRLLFIIVLLFAFVSYSLSEDLKSLEPTNVISNETTALYNVGIQMGIINPEKYTLESFSQHEKDIFKDVYQEYLAHNESLPLNYQDWLIVNNYGILLDTQESLFQRKIVKRSTADNKRRFMSVVKRGYFDLRPRHWRIIRSFSDYDDGQLGFGNARRKRMEQWNSEQ